MVKEKKMNMWINTKVKNQDVTVNNYPSLIDVNHVIHSKRIASVIHFHKKSKYINLTIIQLVGTCMYIFIFYAFIYRPFEPTWDNHFDTTLKIHFFFLNQSMSRLMLYI